MPKKAAFIYSDALSHHVLRQDHPMRPVRLRHVYELLDAFDAFGTPTSSLVEPRPATEDEVTACHTRDYVAAVRGLSRGVAVPNARQYGFHDTGDNPIYPGMYDAALLSTGASLVAAEMVMSGQADVAFSVSGGLHHAMPSYASGFCVFNDPAVAIRALLAQGKRVAYVDIDCHHGDGVQSIFYDTDAVLTISVHESGRHLFPGTGFEEDIGVGQGVGYSVNLPLAPYTGNETYQWAFDQVVPPLLEAYRPDVLVTQLGIDTYYGDPLTHLALTTRGYIQVVQSLSESARGIPWVALGGGGYDLSAVARCWALAYGVMAGREWPNDVPEQQRQRLGTATMRDDETSAVPQEMAAVRQYAEATVLELRRRVFPYHGL